MAYNYSSINVIMEELLDNPLLSDLTLKNVIVHVINFYRIVGVPNFFLDRTETLVVDNYRAQLPFDFYEINRLVKEDGTNIGLATSIANFDPVVKHTNPKFFIQDGVIYCNFQSGKINLHYQAIPLDDEQVPLIIDNSNFIRAVVNYITVNRYRRLFDMGKISPAVYQNAKQENAWSIGSCETEFQRLNLPGMQNFVKVVRNNNSSDNFNNNLNDIGYNG